ncbi:MAG: hypothetical protein QXZ43_02685 [Candidatus Aenigmatarchaeota archaeon]
MKGVSRSIIISIIFLIIVIFFLVLALIIFKDRSKEIGDIFKNLFQGTLKAI